MTDDIVTRLRDNCACSGTEQFGYTCTSCTAADEIERLRAEQEELRRQYHLIHEELQRWQGLCDSYYHKLAQEPDNTLYFIFGYRFLAAGGK